MKDIVLETIESYNEYIAKVSGGCVRISDFLRKDQISEAMRLILDFSEGMGWLVEASNLLMKNEVKATLEVEKIHEFLHEVNSGLEIQDYVLVADMFEYEIAPFFEKSMPAEVPVN